MDSQQAKDLKKITEKALKNGKIAKPSVGISNKQKLEE